MDASTLVTALNLASGSLHNIDFVKVLTHFCFTDKQFYAWNDRAATIVDLDTGLNCGLRGDSLLDVTKTFQGDVRFAEEENGVRIRCGRSNVLLPSLTAAAYVFERPELEDPATLELTGEMIEAFDQCNDSVHKDSLKPAIGGVTVEFDGDDMYLRSTDNMTVVSIRFPDVGVDGGGAIIIPKATVNQIVKVYNDLKSDLDSCTLRFDDRYVEITFIGKLKVVVVSKLIREQPFHFADLVDKIMATATDSLSLPDSFDGTVTRAAALVGTDQSSRIQFALKDRTLTINSVGQYGKTETISRLDEEFDEATVSCDPKLVARFVGRGTHLQLTRNGYDASPAIVLSRDDGNRIYLVAGYPGN